VLFTSDLLAMTTGVVHGSTVRSRDVWEHFQFVELADIRVLLKTVV